MFTVEQILEAHSKVKSGADFPAYIQAIKALGVTRYETFVQDGHSLFTGDLDVNLQLPAKYEAIPVQLSSDKDALKRDLKAHQQGQTSFLTFCQDAANAGVVKWVVNLKKMTCTYLDMAGNELLVESIPSV